MRACPEICLEAVGTPWGRSPISTGAPARASARPVLRERIRVREADADNRRPTTATRRADGVHLEHEWVPRPIADLIESREPQGKQLKGGLDGWFDHLRRRRVGVRAGSSAGRARAERTARAEARVRARGRRGKDSRRENRRDCPDARAPDSMRDLRCGAKWLIEVGHPADRLVAAAADTNASMIVVGSHGSRSSLLGSVSADVSRRASCPVVVVPPGRRRPPERQTSAFRRRQATTPDPPATKPGSVATRAVSSGCELAL